MSDRIGKIVRSARFNNDLPQVLVSSALGRSQWWLSAVERGLVAFDDLTAKRILEAIARLGKIKENVPKADNAFSDLRLPSRVEMANRNRKGSMKSAGRRAVAENG